ncbi:protein virilizer-like [Daktulosphaira vitifoliae]|uniref:protein virilizer-like n=1 Tax=Daktulosphaira vitifoliae TaxID=58002 RepID=UPI0021AA5115|nr:protein virilizer-like [Daktulosphaira vitifoliae]
MSFSTETFDFITFETFSHAYPRSNEICYDVIRFKMPVQVAEIRIVPSSMMIDTMTGIRDGNTNPTEFSVQFYINNINDETATTFENLGRFDYDEKYNIDYKCNSKIWSDRLIVSGPYTSISIAIFGSKNSKHLVFNNESGKETNKDLPLDFDPNSVTIDFSKMKLSSHRNV